MNLTENISVMQGKDATYGHYVRILDKRFGIVFEWTDHFGTMVNHIDLGIDDIQPLKKQKVIESANAFILELE